MKKGICRICRICGKSIKPRGMGGHMSLAHGIREKEVIKYVFDPSGDSGGEVNESKKSPVQIGHEKIAEKMGEKLVESIDPDTSNTIVKEKVENWFQSEHNLYNETDIKILLARIINYLCHSEQTSILQEFAKRDMIEDFEKRFKCRFDMVRKANQHINFGKTEPERQKFANKYAYLEYSR